MPKTPNQDHPLSESSLALDNSSQPVTLPNPDHPAKQTSSNFLGNTGVVVSSRISSLTKWLRGHRLLTISILTTLIILLAAGSFLLKTNPPSSEQSEQVETSSVDQPIATLEGNLENKTATSENYLDEMLDTLATDEQTTNSPLTDSAPAQEEVPSSNIEPTATPQPTPTPTPTLTPQHYSLSRSTSSVEIEEGIEYSIYATLKLDDQIVTDQSDINYVWQIEDSSIADIDEFRVCTNNIQSPCPDDHASIKALQSGSTTIKVTAFKNLSTGAAESIVSTTFSLTVTDRPSDPPQIRISYPTAGQEIVLTSPTQQFCVVDAPEGGNLEGLQRKVNKNGTGWSSWETHSTLCYEPTSGDNTLELQYRNVNGDESPVYKVEFVFTRQ